MAAVTGIKVEGTKKVIDTLNSKRLLSFLRDNVSVIVGYQTNYALRVHEDEEMQRRREARDGVGQWKYLEEPFRKMSPEIKRIIRTTRKATGSTLQGMLIAGMRLQRESQKLVPIDTGNLKGSAFTKKE